MPSAFEWSSGELAAELLHKRDSFAADDVGTLVSDDHRESEEVGGDGGEEVWADTTGGDLCDLVV